MSKFRITRQAKQALENLLSDAALCGADREIVPYVKSLGYGRRLAEDLARGARRCRDAALRNAGGQIAPLSPERRREALLVIEIGRAAMRAPAPARAAAGASHAA